MRGSLCETTTIWLGRCNQVYLRGHGLLDIVCVSCSWKPPSSPCFRRDLGCSQNEQSADGHSRNVNDEARVAHMAMAPENGTHNGILSHTRIFHSGPSGKSVAEVFGTLRVPLCFCGSSPKSRLQMLPGSLFQLGPPSLEK